jgi:SHS2 domain-containing protein
VGHRLLEHVGEVELALEAPTEQGLFSEAAAAFRELVDGGPVQGEALRREIELGGPELARLLVDWLDELVFLAEVEAFVPQRVATLELDDSGLRATVEGMRGRPRHLVKGATVHDLDVSRRGKVWRARVVLDV